MFGLRKSLGEDAVDEDMKQMIWVYWRSILNGYTGNLSISIRLIENSSFYELILTKFPLSILNIPLRFVVFYYGCQ